MISAWQLDKTWLSIAIVAITLPCIFIFWPQGNHQENKPEDPFSLTIKNQSELSWLCQNYHRLTGGGWPKSIGALSYVVLITNTNILVDGWGRPFVFRIATNPATTFWLISYGADGLPGGLGSNADLVMQLE
jgi:hypothetical protein